MIVNSVRSTFFHYRRCKLLRSDEYQHGCLPSVKQSQKGKHLYFVCCRLQSWRVENVNPGSQVYWFIELLLRSSGCNI